MAKRLEYQQALGLPGVMVGKLADEVKYGKLMHQKAKQSTTLDRKNGGHDWLSDTTADRLSCAEVRCDNLSALRVSDCDTAAGRRRLFAGAPASRYGVSLRPSLAQVIKLSEHFLSEHATSSGKGSDWAMPLASRCTDNIVPCARTLLRSSRSRGDS